MNKLKLTSEIQQLLRSLTGKILDNIGLIKGQQTVHLINHMIDYFNNKLIYLNDYYF